MIPSATPNHRSQMGRGAEDQAINEGSIMYTIRPSIPAAAVGRNVKRMKGPSWRRSSFFAGCLGLDSVPGTYRNYGHKAQNEDDPKYLFVVHIA